MTALLFHIYTDEYSYNTVSLLLADTTIQCNSNFKFKYTFHINNGTQNSTAYMKWWGHTSFHYKHFPVKKLEYMFLKHSLKIFLLFTVVVVIVCMKRLEKNYLLQERLLLCILTHNYRTPHNFQHTFKMYDKAMWRYASLVVSHFNFVRLEGRFFQRTNTVHG